MVCIILWKTCTCRANKHRGATSAFSGRESLYIDLSGTDGKHMKTRGSVFISYSHQDEVWKDRLVLHLGVLENQSLLQLWDDRQIAAGADWFAEIESAIESAKIAILLVSANSLTSAFILKEEIRRLLDRHRQDGLVIIPVVVKPCAWDAVEWLSRLQLRPRDGRALSSGTDFEVDEALTSLSREIALMLRGLDHSAPSGSPSRSSAEKTTPGPVVADPSMFLRNYERLHTIHEGRYSRVIKCRKTDTLEICVLKETAAEHVSLTALSRLRDLDCPNIATPAQIWADGSCVYEELPHVGGVRLSKAIAPRIGGLTGAVLESFCKQLHSTLDCLHKEGIIHRDIHPDNIYMVIIKRANLSTSEFNKLLKSRWNYDGFGSGDDAFLIAWVLVDCTFATVLSEAGNLHFSHGPYTSEEQVLGSATPETDLYALGATIYYGITGTQIPSFQTRRLMPHLLSTYPNGGSASRYFSEYLQHLLSLNPAERQYMRKRLDEREVKVQTVLDDGHDSVRALYYGTLPVSGTDFLRCSNDHSDTQLVSGRGALYSYLAQQKEASRIADNDAEHAAWLHRDAQYWIDQLASVGIR
jgi:serine/threonine protein kinase